MSGNAMLVKQNVQQIGKQSGAIGIGHIAALLAVVAFTVGAVLLGPDLLDYYRFGRALAQFERDEVASGSTWPALTDTCVLCHGYDGDSGNQLYPDLAAQPVPYLATQLRAFASGARSHPNMAPLAMTLSDNDVADLAKFFSARTPSANDAFAADAAQAERGAALAATAQCSSCHVDDFSGQDASPRLAGQGYDYLRNQLTAFQGGGRNDSSGAMRGLLEAMSGEDLDALAQYLASRPVRVGSTAH